MQHQSTANWEAEVHENINTEGNRFYQHIHENMHPHIHHFYLLFILAIK